MTATPISATKINPKTAAAYLLRCHKLAVDTRENFRQVFGNEMSRKARQKNKLASEGIQTLAWMFHMDYRKANAGTVTKRSAELCATVRDGDKDPLPSWLTEYAERFNAVIEKVGAPARAREAGIREALAKVLPTMAQGALDELSNSKHMNDKNIAELVDAELDRRQELRRMVAQANATPTPSAPMPKPAPAAPAVPAKPTDPMALAEYEWNHEIDQRRWIDKATYLCVRKLELAKAKR